MPDRPVVSVVVASHGRALRLRWLLNALAEQRFEGDWELVVVHDYDEATTRRVIEAHPLFAARRLDHRAIEPGTGSPALQRNIGWRAAQGPWIAFTDDDCRPEANWLGELMDAVADDGQEMAVQGSTKPDPMEWGVLSAPHVRTLSIDPVGPFCQTCNMLYPRALLERLGGFDEVAVSGEDVGLSLRARAAGTRIVAAPEAVVYHAIESFTLPGILRQNLKWRHLAYLVKRHPEFRRELTLRLFWDEEHLLVIAATLGLAVARKRPAFGLLALPYVARAAARRGRRPRQRATALLEIPGQAVRQLAETVGMAIGSARHRTALL